MFGTKENETKFYMLTSADRSTLFVQTTKFDTALHLIEEISKKFLSLKQLHTEGEPYPVIYVPGYFISVQEVKADRISKRFNKLWEIV